MLQPQRMNKKLTRRRDSERELFLRRHLNSTTFTRAPKATELGEITQNKSRYTVQGHSRSPILIEIDSPYATLYQ